MSDPFLAIFCGGPSFLFGIFLLYRSYHTKFKTLTGFALCLSFGNALLLGDLYLFSSAGWMLTAPLHRKWLMAGMIVSQGVGTLLMFRHAAQHNPEDQEKIRH